jgi:hypothetical protein
MTETNDSVAELERRRKGEQQSSVKNHNGAGRKTQEITRSTIVGEFKVRF